MAEPHQVDDRFVVRNPQLFEKTLLFAVIKSFRFYTKMKDRLCPYDEDRKGRRPDFKKNSHYNLIFGMVADTWDAWEPSIGANWEQPMDLKVLEELFLSEMQQRRISQEDALKYYEEIKLDYDLFQFTPAVFDRLANDRLVINWLDRRAAEGLVNISRNQMEVRPLTLDILSHRIQKAKVALSNAETRIASAADLIDGEVPASIPAPTDLKGINDRTGGGLHGGTTTLLAGCNGAGKTVLAMQWAKHFAQMAANVVVITTEQPPWQLMNRILSNYLHVDYERFTKRTVAVNGQDLGQNPFAERFRSTTSMPMVPPDIRAEYAEQIRKFQDAIRPHLRFVDWSNARPSIYSNFETEIAKIEQTGFSPDVIIFDYIGAGVDSPRQFGGKIEVRFFYKEAIDILVQHAQRTGRILVATAQLNKEQVKQATHVTMNMLAECKSMTDRVENFIGISSLIEKDTSGPSSVVRQGLQRRQYLNVAKARFGKGGCAKVDALFTFQKFKDAEDRLPTTNSL